MSTHLRTSRRRTRSPGLGARSALERSDELGRDPAALVEPGLWLHAMLADPAWTHPAWIECDVVLDPLVPGIRRSVAPGGVLRTAATGEYGPVGRDSLPFTERRALARLETTGDDISGRNVVGRRARGLAHAQRGGGVYDRLAAELDADAQRHRLDARRAWEVPHRDLAGFGDDDVVGPWPGERTQACALRRVGVRGARHRHGLIPGTLRRTRYTLVRAARYNVRPSSSPHAMLAGCSGAWIVPRCLPAGEMTHTPPGPAP